MFRFPIALALATALTLLAAPPARAVPARAGVIAADTGDTAAAITLTISLAGL